MKKLISKLLSLFAAAVISVTAAAVPVSADNVATLPNNEAMLFVDKMGAGWNLGNCFDASDATWVSDEMEYESAWCRAKATKELIKAVKNAGFSTIRVPVSWHNHVDSSLNISEQWIDRVKEVVEWCIDENLYVIINGHHDVKSGYYYPSGS